MVIFSSVTCFPSLTRRSQTGSQADKVCQYLLAVSTINSAVSSQPLHNLPVCQYLLAVSTINSAVSSQPLHNSPPQLQHSLLPLGSIP
jgi:hypothetical protein